MKRGVIFDEGDVRLGGALVYFLSGTFLGVEWQGVRSGVAGAFVLPGYLATTASTRLSMRSGLMRVMQAKSPRWQGLLP